MEPIFINGEWIQSTSTKTFQAVNPVTKEDLPHVFPV
jgi:acyl-CoA reductase-like NAD-dependent aldehyde dehydrogenase